MKWILIVLLAALPLQQARAELASRFGIGPVSSAMGATSLFQGRPSAYQTFNAPAALGFIRRVEVNLGAQYMDPRIRPFGRVLIEANGTQGEFNTAGVLAGGGQYLALALPFGRVRPLTVGAAIYLPFSTLLRVSGTPVNHPFYPLYTDISRNFFFIVGAGYELIDGLAVGVNLRSTTKSIANYTLRSNNSVNYSASAVEGRSQTRPSFSVVYDNERAREGGTPYSLGLTYRAKAGLETRLAADVTVFVPVQGELNSVPAFSPAEWTLAGSLRAWEKWTFSADAAWLKWSAYTSPYGTGNINTQVIGSNRKEAGFRDVPVGRFGVNRQTTQNGFVQKISYRAGYQLHPSPVPNQTGDSNFVDNKRHLFSAGLGLGVQSPFHEAELIDLDLFFQYNWLVRRAVRKDSATNVGAPGYTTGGKILVYGVGATFKF